MIIIKSDDDLAAMRDAGRITARVCAELVEFISPGTTTGEINQLAGELIKGFGAKSAFLGFRGYPGNICVSVNEEVVHGIPGTRRIQIGDIVSLDVGVVYNGFVGDMARTVMIGVSDHDIIRLVETTQKALHNAIDKARAGKRLSDVSHAVEATAVESGFSVVRQFVGHGIGRAMHESPQIPNFGKPGRGPELKPGMTLAVEPMVNMGQSDVEIMNDGWTVLTCDRKPSAHFEDTIAIGTGSAEVLTRAE